MSKRTLDQIAKKLGWMAVWGGTEKLDVHDMSILCSQLADQLRAHIPTTNASTGEQAGEVVGRMVVHEDPLVEANYGIATWKQEMIAKMPPGEYPLYTQPRPVGVPVAISKAPFYWENGGGIKQDSATGYCNGWNDCRKAMIAAAPAPGKGGEA